MNKEVEDYEHNIKIYYEAKRKELDIMLTNSMPSQLSNMKTILWINIVFMALVFQIIKKFPLSDLIIGFYVLSLSSIIIILIAMLTNRTKSYGVHDDINIMSNNYIDINNPWNKSQAIYDMVNTIQYSIEENRIVLSNRGKLMHLATWFSFFSIFIFVLCFILKQFNL